METGKMEDERREGGRLCVGVVYSRDLSTAAFFLCVCVCVRERVSKGGGTLGTPPALQQVVCFCECVCMCVFSSPHTTNGSSSHPAHRPPLPLVAMETHLERAPQRGAYSSSSSFRPLLSSSPDASVALSPSVPSSLLSSPRSLPSLPSFFPSSRCLSPVSSPSVAWLGLRPFHHQGPNTHFTALTHTHPHSYSLGMGGLTGTGKASNGR